MNKTPISAEKNGLLTLRRPDDFHLHLRDGEILKAVLPFTTKQFARAVVMPNLNPPVTTVAAMEAYREIILAAVPQGHDFTPLMTLYLCDDTLPEVIRVGHQKGILTAVKWYPAGRRPMQNTVSRLLVEYAAVSIYFRRWGSHFSSTVRALARTWTFLTGNAFLLKIR
ncbi:dihydroorotase [Klebsiella michiganensis]|nr:dihydroorotase [Klebsiella michiganensis]